MLEHQIEKLTERVASLEAKQDRSNDLLEAILSAIREGGLPPAPSAVVAVDNTTADQSDEAPAEPPASVTVEDVREALMNYRDHHGKDATVELMQRFLPEGAKPILSEIPATSFADLVAVCTAPEKVAA
jgi:hypothetical protein